MKARRLLEQGVIEFREYLVTNETDASIAPPWNLLEDANLSREVPDAPDLDQGFDFENNKFNAASYLVERFSSLPNNITYAHNGLWSWLGLFYLDQTYPVEHRGRGRQGYRYCFQADYQETNYQTYYRHLLYTPFQLLRAHNGDVGKSLLAGQLTQPGGMVEEIASRLELISNPTVLSAVDKLYLADPGEPLRVKVNASPGGRNFVPGNIRRFVEVLHQLDLTYDFYGMSSDQLLARLPAEFDAWKSDHAQAPC